MPKRILKGVVVSDKNDKTIIVDVQRTIIHQVLKKIIRTNKKYHVHDQNNVAKIGDNVFIQENIPISKKKKWILIENPKAS